MTESPITGSGGSLPSFVLTAFLYIERSCARIMPKRQSSLLSIDIFQHKYNKRHTIEAFPPGDVVSIRVPKKDRTATDPHRIFRRALAVPHHNWYKLQTAHEVLNIHYPVTVLTRAPPEARLDAAANILETELPNIITLHTASARMSTSERISVSCNCKPPCCTGKCRCFKKKVKSSVHCHATEFDYHNLSELAIRTEVALVDRGMEEDEQFPEEE